MKKIILLLLALLVLVGAGGGAYFFLFNKPEGEHAEEQAPKKPSGPPSYVTVGPMIVPVVGPTRVEQNVMIVLSLEVENDSKREQVSAQRPRLIDAYVQALYGGIEQGQVVDGQILNIPHVKQKLVEATEKVLGPGMVQDVLIQSVSQRPAF
ncbi:hypothetical protein HHL28_05790 [Aerophototrophica crusticola]|uniref:Flagellar protein FliL n=1 Tax=Aerophototrophica crusticola TaxID=1709002 RepID=A0A858R5L2_9PROT|nr:hypothetical protein HHL28_05790 [Rhodospirillaceae bacterium B3]